MPARLLMTAGILVFGLLIPMLEVNATHLFNPDWPQHARFHDAWQLITNASLAVLCLWLVWVRGEIALAAAIGACVMGGVVLAHALGDLYEGYATYEGGTELTLLGLPAAVAIPLAAVAMFATATFIERRKA